MATGTTSPLYGTTAVQYIAAGAQRRGLDPAAVLAVATAEGSFSGAVGDNGTSFGPFQLHIGGALPSGIPDPKTWANTPAGIDYALDKIAGVAKGLSGLSAITSIVSRFEHPAAPGPEIQRASGQYVPIHRSITAGDWASVSGGHGGGVGGAVAGAIKSGAVDAAGAVIPGFGGIVTGAETAGASASDIVSGVEAPFKALSWAFNNWDRILEVVGGGLLLVVGSIMLGRHLTGGSTNLGDLASGKVAASARDKGYGEGFEMGQNYADEKVGKAAQAKSDRRAIRANKSSATRAGYADEIPF